MMHFHVLEPQCLILETIRVMGRQSYFHHLAFFNPWEVLDFFSAINEKKNIKKIINHANINMFTSRVVTD